MALVNDFSIDENGELAIKGGDFVVDASDELHIEDILRGTPGAFKQFPLLGVGIDSDIEAEHTRRSLDDLDRRIHLNLTSDGYKVNDTGIKLVSNKIVEINIDADRP